jgi:2-isopropylmalate synthase
MFLELADSRKEVDREDMIHLMENYRAISGKEQGENSRRLAESIYKLVAVEVVSNEASSMASVKLKKGGELKEASSKGDGPIDAVCTAIRSIAGLEVHLIDYRVNSVTRENKVSGKVSMALDHNNKLYSAKAMDADILKASALAYLSGINKVIIESALARRS